MNYIHIHIYVYVYILDSPYWGPRGKTGIQFEDTEFSNGKNFRSQAF